MNTNDKENQDPREGMAGEYEPSEAEKAEWRAIAAGLGIPEDPLEARKRPWSREHQQSPAEREEELRAGWTGIPTPLGDPAFQALWDEHRRTCLERKREAEEHEAREADWMMREIMLTGELRRRRREALGAEVIAGILGAAWVGVGLAYLIARIAG